MGRGATLFRRARIHSAYGEEGYKPGLPNLFPELVGGCLQKHLAVRTACQGYKHRELSEMGLVATRSERGPVSRARKEPYSLGAHSNSNDRRPQDVG
jgi:hypothetical protein